MAVTRGRDTKPELNVRKMLYARGWRYRVNFRALADKRRTVDIAFPRQRLAVMIDGCYWHGCPAHFRAPKSTRIEFWRQKIADNQARDADTNQRLAAAGWRVVRFWEHEHPADVVAAIESELTVRR
jgi:DNA mismatch endonuclease (patch repair protein)